MEPACEAIVERPGWYQYEQLDHRTVLSSRYFTMIGYKSWRRTGGPHASLDPAWHDESELYAFCIQPLLDGTGVYMEVALYAELDDGVERLRNYEVAGFP